MHFVKNICEPNKIIVTWQSTKIGARDRLKVAEVLKTDDGKFIFSYLKGTEDYETARRRGFKGYPAFNLNHTYVGNVLDVLNRRLPSKSRTDYDRYLLKFGLKRDVEISDFGILGYTEAKLPSDSFNFIHPFDNAVSSFQFVTEIAGFRYCELKDVEAEKILGRRVNLIHDGQNEKDKDAVKIIYRDKKAGYINKIQAPAFKSWLDNKYHIKAYINSIAGPPSRPEVQVFIDVTI